MWEMEKQLCFIFLKTSFLKSSRKQQESVRVPGLSKKIISQKKLCSASEEPLLINVCLLANSEGWAHTCAQTAFSPKTRIYAELGLRGVLNNYAASEMFKIKQSLGQFVWIIHASA